MSTSLASIFNVGMLLLVLLDGCHHSGSRLTVPHEGARCLSAAAISAAAHIVDDSAMEKTMGKLDSVLAGIVLRIRDTAAEDAGRAPAAAARQAKPPAADAPDCIPEEIEVYIAFTGPDDDIRRLGFTGAIVEKLDRKVASGRMPSARLWELGQLDHVIVAHGPELIFPQLNSSR